MTEQARPYFSYLLRIWQENDREAPIWRASLEDPQSGERKGFLSLDALVAYILDQTGEDQTRIKESLPGGGISELTS